MRTRRKVLIVDDNDDFRRALKSRLKDLPFSLHVLEAVSAETGIVKACEERPAVVLMDIRLPGMNGKEAAVRIKRFLPECHVVMLTMFETPALRGVFKNEAMSDYIGKSEVWDRLEPVLARALTVDAMAGRGRRSSAGEVARRRSRSDDVSPAVDGKNGRS